MAKKDTHLTQSGAEVQRILDGAQRVYNCLPSDVEHPDEGDICFVPAHDENIDLEYVSGSQTEPFLIPEGVHLIKTKIVAPAVANWIVVIRRPQEMGINLITTGEVPEEYVANIGVEPGTTPYIYWYDKDESYLQYLTVYYEAAAVCYEYMNGSWVERADLAQTLEKAKSAYQKPASGIPASDIADGVIPDVSLFITKTVNDLTNYYLKSETYTKDEVAALIRAIQQFHYEVYASTSAVTNPSSNVLYLIGPSGTGTDKYEEYVYDATKQSPWIKIGDTSIDLSDYATISAMNTALAGKQDVIADLVTIRANATSAYQKPSGGIPKTDLDSGVKASLELADSAIQPAEFNELEEEVGTIGNGAYEEAWDGSSAPVVADIPAGVSVTYSGTSYTGTLAASASTVDKIYLVSDGNGNYDRYVTVESGGTYSWKKVGTTAIPLSNYATKSQVNQLGQQVNGFTPLVLTLNNVEYAASGTVSQIYDCDFKQGQKITISATKSSGLTADFSVKYTFFNDSSYSQQESVDINTANTGEITLTRNSLKVRIYIYKSAVTGSGTLTATLEVGAGTSIVSQISALQSGQIELNKTVDALNEDVTPLVSLNDDVVANIECNLVDSSSLLHGYISTTDGGFHASEEWRATDYIRLKGGVKYFFGRFYAGYYAFYDLDKNHLPNAQYFHHINFGYGYILCPEDCYFRGSTASVELADYLYISSVVDGYIPFGEKNFIDGDYAKWAKTPSGSLSPNLFDGRCEIGGIENGQLRDDALSRVRTFPIYCSGTIYLKMFNGKPGDILYIFQYSSGGSYIGNAMLYTTEGVVVLDASAAFIRICTTTRNDGYVPPALDFYRTHLFVTELPDVFGKWLPSGYVITAKDVDDHFFDTASTFEVGYIKTALDTLIHTIKGVGYDAVIPCMTDIHLDDAEPYKMLNYLAASGVADACFNLGDTIRENFPTKAEAVAVLENDFRWSNSMPRKSPLFSLRGNHDTNPVSDASAMISTREFAALAENRTMPGYASNTVNYGYIDLPSKIRLVWLDTSDIFDDNDDPIVFGNYTLIQQGQLDWLCNEALNFKDKKVPGDWSVIVLSHDGAVDLRLTAIIEAFVSGTSASGTIVYDARKAVDMQTDVTVTLQYDVDFSEQGAVDMLCCVCGHYHKDKIADIGTSGVKQVYIACDNVVAHYDDDGTDETYDRTYGTIEEHICDTICVDKSTRTVLFKRLGVGSDRSITY